ncbi:replication initiator protein [Peromfec virus RodF5_6]|uniref:Replication initiator protein n=1 Tax=Peromfec virus RodF5_6 TaxID=2929342 RepID=A0A976N3A7_9VIRU|nr:replication initiator protein [Peromfec virus RodF5_6]
MCNNSKLRVNPNWFIFGKPNSYNIPEPFANFSPAMLAKTSDDLTPEQKFELSKVKFSFGGVKHSLFINCPCGHCNSCLIAKSDEIARRAQMQCVTHPYVYFVRLSYNDENLPKVSTDDGNALPTLIRSHVPSFLKRLRSRLTEFNISGSLGLPEYHSWYLNFDSEYFINDDKLEYDFTAVYVGEYGSENDRPHYHLLMFFRKPFTAYQMRKGFLLRLISDTWKMGFVHIDHTRNTAASCSYMTKYILKCQRANEKLHPQQQPCFFQTPRRAGLGAYDTGILYDIVTKSSDSTTYVKFYSYDLKKSSYTASTQRVTLPWFCIRILFDRINSIYRDLPYYKYLTVLILNTYTSGNFPSHPLIEKLSNLYDTYRYLFGSITCPRLDDFSNILAPKKYDYWWQRPLQPEKPSHKAKAITAYMSIFNALNNHDFDNFYVSYHINQILDYFVNIPLFHEYFQKYVLPFRRFIDSLSRPVLDFESIQKIERRKALLSDHYYNQMIQNDLSEFS